MRGDRFDCLVVGGGPGGYVAAIRARQLGLRTALVERDRLGGVCANWGCIPTKALLHAAELCHRIEHARDFGIETGQVRVDLGALVARSREVAARMAAGVGQLIERAGVERFGGHGRLAGAGRLFVQDGGEPLLLEAPHIVLATGARARALPGLELDGERVWSYREAVEPDALPRSLLVIGSGAIGSEFASFYRDLGCEVTLLEALPRILPAEDAEVSAFVRRAFERRGITVHGEASVEALERRADGIAARVKLASGETLGLEAERAIVAVGIQANVEDLGLDTTRVRVERGHVRTDAWCRTDEPGVYAIGDLAGAPYLAHKASHEGVVCVERIAGHAGARPLERSRIPGCTYSRPQVASVGYSEAAAREAGHAVKVGRFPFGANGKAAAIGDTQGFAKTVFDADSGELLGAHLVGPEVTEMIQGFAIARTLETTEAELVETVFPHPTLSEAMHEAVLDACDRPIHKAR